MTRVDDHDVVVEVGELLREQRREGRERLLELHLVGLHRVPGRDHEQEVDLALAPDRVRAEVGHHPHVHHGRAAGAAHAARAASGAVFDTGAARAARAARARLAAGAAGQRDRVRSARKAGRRGGPLPAGKAELKSDGQEGERTGAHHRATLPQPAGPGQPSTSHGRRRGPGSRRRSGPRPAWRRRSGPARTRTRGSG